MTTAKKGRMTQSEVIIHFAERTGLNRAQVKEFFEELSRLAANEVQSSGEFQLPGFGKLVKSERQSRSGRNPATGETIQIPAKTTLKFRVGKVVKDSSLAGDLGGDPYTIAGDLAGDPITKSD